jgi:hypothetical protein
LTDGWLFGRKVDTSDAQYHSFRENLPYMGALLVLHPLLRRAWEAFYANPDRRRDAGASRLESRASFDFAFAILYSIVLHGFSALKVFLILYINYQLATKLPRKYVPWATWIFDVGVLFANELCQGYHYKWLASLLSPPTDAGRPSNLMRWGKWMDNYGGLMGRWEVLFNITILRLISFNLDYYWSLDRRSSNALEVSPAWFPAKTKVISLISQRRSSLTRLSFLSEIASPCPPSPGNTASAIT